MHLNLQSTVCLARLCTYRCIHVCLWSAWRRLQPRPGPISTLCAALPSVTTPRTTQPAAVLPCPRPPHPPDAAPPLTVCGKARLSMHCSSCWADYQPVCLHRQSSQIICLTNGAIQLQSCFATPSDPLIPAGVLGQIPAGGGPRLHRATMLYVCK